MWFIYSLSFALWASINILFIKKLTKQLSLSVLLFFHLAFILPFMLVFIFLSGGFPEVYSQFYSNVYTASVLNFFAFTSSTAAVKISSISLISPIASFSPIFTTLIASWSLKETLPMIKLLGILVVAFGAYLLHIQDSRQGILKPIVRLVSDRGVQLFFVASTLWAITPIFQKQAILLTTPQLPIFASFSGTLLNCIFMFLLAIRKIKSEISQVLKNIWVFILLGFFNALAQFLAFSAFQQGELGLVTSVFKLSILFSIILGGLFFKEERLKERLIGGSIMVLGTILLVS